MKVSSRVAKQLKTRRKIGKIRKISKLHRIITQCPAPLPQTQNALDTSRRPLKNTNQSFPALRYSTRKLELVQYIFSMIVVHQIRTDFSGFLSNKNI